MDKLKNALKTTQHGRADDHIEEPKFSEKDVPKQKISKRYLFRIFRLGLALAMTTTTLVLILIILVVGRHGDGESDLALITVNMTNFARFTPPTIVLVHNETSSATAPATKTRRGLGSITSAIGSAASSVETFAGGVVSDVKSEASAAKTAVAGVASDVAAVADKAIDAIGDKIEDIENAVEGLMDKVLSTIQDDLNKWLKEAASDLNDLDIPNKMSLHLTTHCSSPSRSSNSSNSTSTSTKSTCKQLFTSGDTNFNATANNGTIFGFQPGNILAKALGVFFVPASAQQDIRAPVDTAANTVTKLMQKAEAEISSWTVNLLFIPIVAIYVIAATLTTLLLLVLILATVLAVKDGEAVPAKIYSLCGTMALLTTGFVFLGSVVLTVVWLICEVLNLGGGIVGIEIESGDRLKWLSWAACLIMIVVTGTFKIEEFVADAVFWFGFFRKLLHVGKGKGGLGEALKSAK